MPDANTPYIPEFITVHLGRPEQSAANIEVAFPEYIKNVASSEIYPTWPENALRANIYVMISYTLNRVYTEWYRNRGYDFDITNSTQFDQAYVSGRETFDNINRITDEIFNDYVRKVNSVEPYFTQFCNGTTSTCPGLSQWGTVSLAEQGKSPIDILKYYYGDDIEIVRNAPIDRNVPSYPGTVIRLGSVSNQVRTIQLQLNRISNNYPAIPKIVPTNGYFRQSTYDSVREFQKIFYLNPDGAVGKSTWYKIKYIYNAVKRLGELSSEGVRYEEIIYEFPSELKEGDTGAEVRYIQYYLDVIAEFMPEIPNISVDGIYGPETTNAVIQFQRMYGIPDNGRVGGRTWAKLLSIYQGIISTLPSTYYSEGQAKFYPGYFLSRDDEGENVQDLQTYLQLVAETYTEIPPVEVTGIFDTQTYDAVVAFQQLFGITSNGIVGPNTWNQLATEYNAITLAGLQL